MKVLLDTNIILVYILKRSPFFEHSKTIFKWAFKQKIIAYVSASAITDIYYLLQRAKNKKVALDFIQDIFQFLQIADIIKQVVFLALQSGIDDFEDAVQYAATENFGIEIIITRNVKDFRKSNLQIISPENFIKIIAQK